MDFGQSVTEKTQFLFNEVTTLTGVKPYVLRFWESEFSQINPSLIDSDKFYSSEDIKAISVIKRLLFEDKLSIPEVKSIIDAEINNFENITVEVVETIRPDATKSKSKNDLSFDTTVNLQDIDLNNLVANSKSKLIELTNYIENIETKYNWI